MGGMSFRGASIMAATWISLVMEGVVTKFMRALTKLLVNQNDAQGAYHGL